MSSTEDTERYCNGCKKTLAKEYFQPSAWKKGRGNRCRSCAGAKSKEYRRLHPEEMKRADKDRYQKYKKTWARRWNIKKYGLTDSDIQRLFHRQRGRCLGCQQSLPLGTSKGQRFNIDHCHTTNKVRGLLCSACNTTLGLVKEDKGTLRRLSAYLDRNPEKTLIYVIGSLRNKNVPAVANSLREEGYDVFDDWFSAGEKADDSWQEYENMRGHTFNEALNGRSAENVFYYDKAWLDLADLAVFVAPGGRSAHLESGYCVGRGKPVLIYAPDDPERFDVMPKFVTSIIRTMEELKTCIAATIAETSRPGVTIKLDNASIRANEVTPEELYA